MSNSISSLSSSISQLFSKLDTKNQGYLEKSDFVSALNQLNTSSGTSSADSVFAALDSDSDGKVSESEFSNTLSQLQEQLDSQFNQMRMHGMGGHGPQGMGGGMPPPPANDEGFTKEELSSQLDEIGNSDNKRSSFIANIVNNFAAADADGNGKVSFSEAKSYNDTSSTSATTGASSTQPSDQGFTLAELQSQLDEIGGSDSKRANFISNVIDNFSAADSNGDGKVNFDEARAINNDSANSGASANSKANSEAQLMATIMQLMHAYGNFGDRQGDSTLSGQLSTSA